jgi:hypothetical protein
MSVTIVVAVLAVLAVLIAIVVILVSIALTPPVAVPVAVMIPVVVVLQAASIAVPVAYKILAALVTRPYPAGSSVWRTRPITVVPSVVPSDGIPIALDPHKIRPRSWGKLANHARGRWRPDADSHGNLSL